jgi:hypothetical protein
MKLLILLLSALFLSGCIGDNYGTTDPTTLKYKAGQTVTVNKGFYQGCSGVIVGYETQYTEQGYAYNVSFYCSNAGRMADTIVLESQIILQVENQ